MALSLRLASLPEKPKPQLLTVTLLFSTVTGP